MFPLKNIKKKDGEDHKVFYFKKFSRSILNMHNIIIN